MKILVKLFLLNTSAGIRAPQMQVTSWSVTIFINRGRPLLHGLLFSPVKLTLMINILDFGRRKVALSSSLIEEKFSSQNLIAEFPKVFLKQNFHR